jgi:RNA polymerase sigma factor (sigma-70 family)
MAVGPSRGVWKQLDGLFRFGVSGHLGDAELLGRYVAGRRDEAAEAAFAALVERHGPMVLGVCRRVLGDRHEAEDAFQATFLVLARKAGAIARREQLANWLHGVASRTARDARARAVRRRRREQKAFATAIAATGPDDGPDRHDLRAALDEELARLPACYRGPVILCELDGLSRQVAARQLGIPEGTLSSRLARAKELLRHRLTRRGLAPAAVAVEVLAHEARAVILPPSLAVSTIEAAARVAAGASLAEAVSASVVTLTQGALNAMLLTKVKGVAFAVATATLVVGTGVGVLAQAPGPAPGDQDDRLGAVERKLDRILEALGSTDRGDRGKGSLFERERLTAKGSAPAGPTGKRVDGDAPPKSDSMEGMMRGRMGMMGGAPAGPGGMAGMMQGDMRRMMGGMMGGGMRQSPPMESRVDDLERRLSDLERRFDQMEHRLSGADRPDAAGPFRSRRVRDEVKKP